MPSLEALEEEIARYRSGDADMLRMWAFVSNGAPVADRITELLRYVEWRKGRRSPPRCLECGAVDPVPIPLAGEFAHPATGERVVVVSQGWADTAPWFGNFSGEGERLEHCDTR